MTGRASTVFAPINGSPRLNPLNNPFAPKINLNFVPETSILEFLGTEIILAMAK
jgi:hypothetical protein